MLLIDGSQGEGGGQVLRTSLALSMITGQPLRVIRIRSARPKPGLMRQHVTAIEAAAAVSGACVEGADVGATEITFRPRAVRGGTYSFSVGTAGSATLVLQTVLPALMTANEPSTLTLEGGTHNPQSPPFDFLARSFLPLLRKMGPRIHATLEQPGFYPAGGGRFTVCIEPSESLQGFHLLERGAIRSYCARAVVASLAKSVADREIRVLAEHLKWDSSCFRSEAVEKSIGPGNVVMVEVESEHVVEVFTGFGTRGVLAETVAENVAMKVLSYLEGDAPVCQHLADQLLLPLALAGGGAFRTLEPSSHARTQAEVIRTVLGRETTFKELANGSWHIEVGKNAS